MGKPAGWEHLKFSEDSLELQSQTKSTHKKAHNVPHEVKKLHHENNLDARNGKKNKTHSLCVIIMEETEKIYNTTWMNTAREEWWWQALERKLKKMIINFHHCEEFSWEGTYLNVNKRQPNNRGKSAQKGNFVSKQFFLGIFSSSLAANWKQNSSGNFPANRFNVDIVADNEMSINNVTNFAEFESDS